ncbi:MAG TPA: hypothetical protein PLV94_05700 [Spirochaetota bacterium]|nr:hypothetical protein [Spirochaetota bacterium]
MRLKLTLLILILASFSYLKPASVSITAVDGGNQAILDTLASTINANSPLTKLGDQKDFAKGMGEAAAFSHNTAATYSYQNYTLFALMVGYNVGVVTKDIETDGELDISNAKDKLKDEGDVYAGASANFAFNLGVNITLIKALLGFDPDNALYANIKYGKLKTTTPIAGAKIDNYFFGIGLSYQLIPSLDFVVGSWRGIAINSGFYMSKQKSELPLSYSSITSGGYTLDPTLTVKADSTVYTVPLEATTAFSLFFINISAGAGVDFVFGDCGADVTVDSDVKDGSNNTVGKVTLDDANVSGVSPTFISPKIMFGAGIQIALLKLDVPVSYYFKQKAITVGFSAGVVF